MRRLAASFSQIVYLRIARLPYLYQHYHNDLDRQLITAQNMAYVGSRIMPWPSKEPQQVETSEMHARTQDTVDVLLQAIQTRRGRKEDLVDVLVRTIEARQQARNATDHLAKMIPMQPTTGELAILGSMPTQVPEDAIDNLLQELEKRIQARNAVLGAENGFSGRSGATEHTFPPAATSTVQNAVQCQMTGSSPPNISGPSRDESSSPESFHSRLSSPSLTPSPPHMTAAVSFNPLPPLLSSQELTDDNRDFIMFRNYGHLDDTQPSGAAFLTPLDSLPHTLRKRYHDWSYHHITRIRRGDRYMMQLDTNLYKNPRWFIADGICIFPDGSTGMVCLGTETNHYTGIPGLPKERRLGCIPCATAPGGPGNEASHGDRSPLALVFEGCTMPEAAYVDMLRAMIFRLDQNGYFFASSHGGRLAKPSLDVLDEVGRHIGRGFGGYCDALMRYNVRRMGPPYMRMKVVVEHQEQNKNRGDGSFKSLQVPRECEVCADKNGACPVLDLIHRVEDRRGKGGNALKTRQMDGLNAGVVRKVSAVDVFPYDPFWVGHDLKIPWLEVPTHSEA